MSRQFVKYFSGDKWAKSVIWRKMLERKTFLFKQICHAVNKISIKTGKNHFDLRSFFFFYYSLNFSNKQHFWANFLIQKCTQ